MKGECSNCNYFTEIEEYGPDFGQSGPTELCAVCAYTFLSRAGSPSTTQGETWMMRSIAQLANALFDGLGLNAQEVFDKNVKASLED